MLLTVNGDESIITNSQGQLDYLVLAAYMGSRNQWDEFSREWGVVLKMYDVPHFHFREFHAKQNATNPESDYYQWDAEKRDDFFYDLALAIGENLVPVGGAYSVKTHREHSLTGDVLKGLFATFFASVCRTIDRHWPELRGQDCSSRVQFVFDNNRKTWRESLTQVYDDFKAKDAKFSGISFQDDTDPAHVGLQAADFIAAIYPQTAIRNFETGQTQKPRLIDFILFRNLDPIGGVFNIGQVAHPIIFKALVEEFRKHEKYMKREWADRNLSEMKYYPADHIESLVIAMMKRAPELAPRLNEAIQKMKYDPTAFEKFRELTQKRISAPNGTQTIPGIGYDCGFASAGDHPVLDRRHWWIGCWAAWARALLVQTCASRLGVYA